MLNFVRGCSNKEQVIKNHLRSIFDKLGVRSRLELASVRRLPRRPALGRAFAATTDRDGLVAAVAGDGNQCLDLPGFHSLVI